MWSKKALFLIFYLTVLLLLPYFPLQKITNKFKDGFNAVIIKAHVRQAIRIATEQVPSHKTQDALFRKMFPPNTTVKVNSHITPLLSCPYTINANTQHVRIPFARLHQIHMTPRNQPPSKEQYFNPAILQLPRSSKYDYLILSRLVTPGFHQETHFCPAVINATTRDIQCLVPPKRLNIAPTSAYRCTGRWASFADIPGFHDPRVLWSGKGEPLVIVNSASAARPNGCVGLWVVDLRVVIDEMNQWVQNDWHANVKENSEAQSQLQNNAGPFVWHPKMSYPYLTEITKNPRSDRSPIEKNWVLFFPKGEESWVMYDMLRYESIEGAVSEEKDHHESSNSTSGLAIVKGVEGNGASASSSTSTATQRETGHVNVVFDLGTYLNKTSPYPEVKVSNTGNATASPTDGKKRQISPEEQVFPQQFESGHVRLRPSRSFAKLLGAGFTTTNLTSPNEAPCFDENHIHDSFNNTGYWHQGSNALRLVLCRRPGSATNPSIQIEECLLTTTNEAKLVEQGKVVHFMVMHRKFSNAFKLPMRYERYFLVWEARWPFRVLGVTSHPILFDGERAQPWSEQANWPPESSNTGKAADRRKEREKWKDTYFTYTLSLTWVKRRPGHDESQFEMLQTMGTGYIGDEVVIGVGMDDVKQGFVQLKVEDILCCLRRCPDFEPLK